MSKKTNNSKDLSEYSLEELLTCTQCSRCSSLMEKVTKEDLELDIDNYYEKLNYQIVAVCRKCEFVKIGLINQDLE